MTAAAWIAIASLMAMVFINVAVCAFMLGRLSQRVTTLERDNSVLMELRDGVTRLTEQMSGAKDDISHVMRDVSGLQRSISNMMTDRASRSIELPASRRRKPE